MKRKISYKINRKTVEREVTYIPIRYIIAIMISVFEILAIITVVIALCYYVPYFYVAATITQVVCVLKIIASDDNPDYKVPWLLILLLIPIAGFMLYLMFYSRKLKRKFLKRRAELQNIQFEKDDTEEYAQLKKESMTAYTHAKMLSGIASVPLFYHTEQTYFSLGEDMHKSLLHDLQSAEKFIYLEYFIIEAGIFWNSILDILKEKVEQGVEVKVLYDDIGCMTTLPGNYSKVLQKYGIDAVSFSRLRGSADSEFNNRNHRKIAVIDGKIGYTGGVNIADEYINEKERFGHWKDTAVRICGEAVLELTYLFLCDYGISVKKMPPVRDDLYPAFEKSNADCGYMIPFGDGPRPIYARNIGKSVIQNMLSAANNYVYLTTPYLIIDNDLCCAIENTALRGVDVRIIVPHIPDKKMVFTMTKSFYNRLLAAGVRIYEYTPGFIHAKCCVADGEYAMIGTINLDYRSLVHHFENGIWMYRCPCIADMKIDIDNTLAVSQEITQDMLKTGLFVRFWRAVIRVFAPML